MHLRKPLKRDILWTMWYMSYQEFRKQADELPKVKKKRPLHAIFMAFISNLSAFYPINLPKMKKSGQRRVFIEKTREKRPLHAIFI